MQLFNVGGPPIWIQDPSHANVEWIQAIIARIWPKVDHAFTSWAFKDQSLERLLNATTFWKPAWLATSGVRLHNFSLGNIPFNVTSVKILQKTQDNALVMDIQFDWVSKMAIQLSMKTLSKQQQQQQFQQEEQQQQQQSILSTYYLTASLRKSSSMITGLANSFLSLVFSTITIKVLVRELIARGRIRIVASPLLNTLPVVGAVRVSLLEPPSISYRISTFGHMNPLLLPGVEQFINSFLSTQLFKPFMFPDGYVVNISKLLGYDESLIAPVRPVGVLVLKVIGAQNVPRMDFFGGCDPYVKIYLTKKFKQRTTVKSNTLCPEWNEEFQFLVHSMQHQILHMEIWDSDVLTPDDIIGVVDVPLEELQLTPGKERKVSVAVVHPTKKFEKKKEKKELDCKSPDKVKSLVEFHDDDESDVVGGDGVIVDSNMNNNGGGDGGDSNTNQQQQQQQQQQYRRHNKKYTTTTSTIFADAYHNIKHTFKRSNKECTINLSVVFYPFSQHDMNAASEYYSMKTTGGNFPINTTTTTISNTTHQQQQQQTSTSASASTSSTTMTVTEGGVRSRLATLSPRARRVLAGGVLHIKIFCAENLPTKSASFNKRYIVSIKVSRRGDTVPRYAKKAERGGQGLNSRAPLFDQAVDFLIDGDTALAADTIITIEIWSQHLLRKATYKGAACVLLQKVIQNERLHDMYALDTGGRVELGLEWQGMMTQVTSL